MWRPLICLIDDRVNITNLGGGIRNAKLTIGDGNMYRPRLSTELTPTQHTHLLNILPFGLQKPLFQTLVNGVIELYERGGVEAIGAIASQYISITHIVEMGLLHTKREQIKLLEKRIEELKS